MMERIDGTQFSFADIGCSNGGSLVRYADFFSTPKPGIGFDIDPEKVQNCVDQGHEVLLCDIRSAVITPPVQFCVLHHVLEHIQSRQDVAEILSKSLECCSDFVIIRQPYFDQDGALARMGFKLYWSDWGGHPFHATTLDFVSIAQALMASGHCDHFKIGYKYLVENSDHEAVHSLDSPPNQKAYDPKLHPKKREGVRFESPAYRETIVILRKNGSAVNTGKLLQKFRPDALCP